MPSPSVTLPLPSLPGDMVPGTLVLLSGLSSEAGRRLNGRLAIVTFPSSSPSRLAVHLLPHDFVAAAICVPLKAITLPEGPIDQATQHLYISGVMFQSISLLHRHPLVAAQSLEKLLQSCNPGLSERALALATIGRSYRAAGHPDVAVRFFKETLALSGLSIPDVINEVVVELSELLAESARFDQALTEAARVADASVARLALRAVFSHVRNCDSAPPAVKLRAFSLLLENSPEDVECLVELGWLQVRVNDQLESLESFSEASAISQRSPPPPGSFVYVRNRALGTFGVVVSHTVNGRAAIFLFGHPGPLARVHQRYRPLPFSLRADDVFVGQGVSASEMETYVSFVTEFAGLLLPERAVLACGMLQTMLAVAGQQGIKQQVAKARAMLAAVQSSGLNLVDG